MTSDAAPVESGGGRRGAVLCLALVAAAAVGLTTYRVATGVSDHRYLYRDRASGAYAGLAVDAARGEWYRDVESDRGFGGTRYLPGHVALHALLIRAGLPAAAGGHLIALAALAVLLGAVAFELRRRGVSPAAAIVLALLVLASRPMQQAVTRIAADLPAAALSLVGFLALAPRIVDGTALRGRRLAAAGALFVLAFAFKLTTVYGVAACVLALWLGRRRKEAAWLAGGVALGGALVLLGGDLASHGRLFESLRANLFNGGGGGDALRAPLGFADDLVLLSPASLGPLALAFALVALAGRRALRDPFALQLGLATLSVVAIHASPSVDYNHFLDLDVLAVLAIATVLLDPAARARFSPLLPLTFGVFAVAAIWLSARQNVSPSRRAAFDAALAAAGPSSDGPLLAENAWIPILRGEHPVLLDSDAFRQISLARPRMALALEEQLRARRYRAVILERRIDPEWPMNHEMIQPGFVAALRDGYRLAWAEGSYFVWTRNR